MVYPFVTITTGIVASLIAIFFSFKIELWKKGRFLFPFFSITLLSMALVINFTSSEIDFFVKEIWLRIAVSLLILTGLFLLEIDTDFLGEKGINPLFYIANKPLKLAYLWRTGITSLIIITIFFRWFTFSFNGEEIVIVIKKGMGDIISSGIFICYLLNLYFLEKIFRNTTIIQKRSFISFLSASGIISLFVLIGIVKILYYRVFTIEILKIYSIIAELSFIVILISILRYRMWEEKIEVGRGMIYTSLTVVFFGAFVLVLSCLGLITKILGVKFKQFDSFIIVFTTLFGGAILIFSPNMRKTITHLSLKYIYKSKYDYRDQFLRLHNIYKEAGDLKQTIRAFIDNLCYTLIIKDAKVFVFDEIKNGFSMIEEFPSFKGKLFIPKKSTIIEIFETEMVSYIEVVGLIETSKKKSFENSFLQLNINQINFPFENHFTHFFAIKYRWQLMGVLAIDKGNKDLDSEDIMIIEILCDSIGAAIYRDKIEKERIEAKQIESFTHTTSIIAHNIKDQVGLLSVLAENAKNNINNKEYHPVLISSLENCAAQLTLLIEKLKRPPQTEMLKITEIDCNAIVRKVIREIKPALKEDIIIKENLGEMPHVLGDIEALSYLIKNLLINSIEAIRSTKSPGIITCTTSSLKAMVPEDTFGCILNASDLEKYSVCITIEDNGPGIKKDFLEEKLFRPFNTTKEKGIGLGLYQCKILIEKMGGKIFCKSEENKGTIFFITL